MYLGYYLCTGRFPRRFLRQQVGVRCVGMAACLAGPRVGMDGGIDEAKRRRRLVREGWSSELLFMSSW